MSKEAGMGCVMHRASGNYCYALDQDTLRISIRAGEEVKSVTLVWGDPFSAGVMGADVRAWRGEKVQMTRRRELGGGIVWWSTDVKPPFKRARYYFYVDFGDVGDIGRMLFCEDGFHPLADEGTMRCLHNAYTFPWMNEADIAQVPAWAGDTVWYQIFPARFRRGESANVPLASTHDTRGNALLEWAPPDRPVTNNERYGGNIAGITEELDYLASLGVTGVYLTPVNLSPSEHKYDTTDYLTIDPDFGTADEMRRMTSEAHGRGIKVMLDGVFNHCGTGFFAWQDVVQKRDKSRYKDWFIINDMGFDAHDWHNAMNGKFYTFGFHDGMPKLNTNNAEVRDYICSVCEQWVRDYDIDALRLDVANEISHVLCRELRSRLKGVKSDFYIVGEIWHNALPWLEGDQFDAVMNYPLSNALLDFASDKTLTARHLERELNRCLVAYSEQVTRVLLNQLDSHDTMRVANRVGSQDAALQCLVLLFCLPGAACIYYGTEVLLHGGHDPDCRRCMPWGKAGDVQRFVQDVIRLRREEKALRTYDTCFVHEDSGDGCNGGGRVVHIVKTADGSTIDALFNFGDGAFDTRGMQAADSGGSSVLLARNYAEGMIASGGLVLFKRNK